MTTTETLRVAIQGVAGCFHDAAAREYFKGKRIEPVECDTFREMFERLEADPEMRGIMAIENTIAGSLLPNHELLRAGSLRVVGELKMRISHSLCALPGQTIDELTEVHSHPMALRQCEQFLRRHRNLRMVEDFDTAGAARNIASDRRRGAAAICSSLAAATYGLEVIESGIETNKHNFTRFLALSHSKSTPADIDKASVAFTLPHTKGALSKVLAILSFYDLNLTKIQSTPIIGREWEYSFYVDLTFDDADRYRQAIAAVRPLLTDFRLLGEYRESTQTC